MSRLLTQRQIQQAEGRSVLSRVIYSLTPFSPAILLFMLLFVWPIISKFSLRHFIFLVLVGLGIFLFFVIYFEYQKQPNLSETIVGDLLSDFSQDCHDSRNPDAVLMIESRTKPQLSDSTNNSAILNNDSQRDHLVKPFPLCYCCGYRLESRLPLCPRCKTFIRCPICWDQIKLGENANICPYCESRFHQKHLADWLKIKQKCPVCRHVLLIA